MTILDDILAAITAALLLALGVLLIVNANLRADLARADSSAVTLTQINADLRNAAARQDDAIAALRAESAVKSLAAAKAVKRAARLEKRAVAEAAAIAKQPATGDDCAAAAKILRDYLTKR